MEHSESRETTAVVGQLADAVGDGVDHLLADGVATTSEVVGGILLGLHEVLRVEELLVGSSANLIGHIGLKVNEESTGDHLARGELGEHGSTILVASDGGEDILVRRDRAIRFNALLEAEELPTRVT